MPKVIPTFKEFTEHPSFVDASPEDKARYVRRWKSRAEGLAQTPEQQEQLDAFVNTEVGNYLSSRGTLSEAGGEFTRAFKSTVGNFRRGINGLAANAFRAAADEVARQSPGTTEIEARKAATSENVILQLNRRREELYDDFIEASRNGNKTERLRLANSLNAIDKSIRKHEDILNPIIKKTSEQGFLRELADNQEIAADAQAVGLARLQQKFESSDKFKQHFGGFTYALSGAAGELPGQIAQAITAPGLVSLAADIGQREVDKAREIDPTLTAAESLSIQLGVGASNALLERVGFDAMLGRIFKEGGKLSAKEVAKRAAIAAVSEGTTEVAQSAVANEIVENVTNIEQTTFSKEDFKERAIEFLVGATLGGSINTVASTVELGLKAKEQQQKDAPEQTDKPYFDENTIASHAQEQNISYDDAKQQLEDRASTVDQSISELTHEVDNIILDEQRIRDIEGLDETDTPDTITPIEPVVVGDDRGGDQTSTQDTDVDPEPAPLIDRATQRYARLKSQENLDRADRNELLGLEANLTEDQKNQATFEGDQGTESITTDEMFDLQDQAPEPEVATTEEPVIEPDIATTEEPVVEPTEFDDLSQQLSDTIDRLESEDRLSIERAEELRTQVDDALDIEDLRTIRISPSAQTTGKRDTGERIDLRSEPELANLEVATASNPAHRDFQLRASRGLVEPDQTVDDITGSLGDQATSAIFGKTLGGKSPSELLKTFGTKVRVIRASVGRANPIGFYDENNNIISLSEDVFDAPHQDLVGQMLRHEIVHAFTVQSLKDGNTPFAKEVIRIAKEAFTKIPSEVRGAISKLDVQTLVNYMIQGRSISEIVGQDFSLKLDGRELSYEEKIMILYGLTDPKEFVAQAITDPTFTKWLASIEDKNKVPLLTKLWLSIAKFFKNSVPNNLLNSAIEAVKTQVETNASIAQGHIDLIARITGANQPLLPSLPTSLPANEKTVSDFQRVVEDVFGAKVQYYNDPQDSRNGYYDGFGTIHVNTTEGRSPITATLGHELTHHIEETNPELFKQLVNTIGAAKTNKGRLVNYYNSLAQSYAQEDLPREFIANIMGEAVHSPEVMSEFVRLLPENQKRGFLDTVFTKITEFLNRLRSLLRSNRNKGALATFENSARGVRQVALAIRNYRLYGNKDAPPVIGVTEAQRIGMEYKVEALRQLGIENPHAELLRASRDVIEEDSVASIDDTLTALGVSPENRIPENTLREIRDSINTTVRDAIGENVTAESVTSLINSTSRPDSDIMITVRDELLAGGLITNREVASQVAPSFFIYAISEIASGIPNVQAQEKLFRRLVEVKPRGLSEAITAEIATQTSAQVLRFLSGYKQNFLADTVGDKQVAMEHEVTARFGNKFRDKWREITSDKNLRDLRGQALEVLGPRGDQKLFNMLERLGAKIKAKIDKIKSSETTGLTTSRKVEALIATIRDTSLPKSQRNVALNEFRGLVEQILPESKKEVRRIRRAIGRGDGLTEGQAYINRLANRLGERPQQRGRRGVRSFVKEFRKIRNDIIENPEVTVEQAIERAGEIAELDSVSDSDIREIFEADARVRRTRREIMAGEARSIMRKRRLPTLEQLLDLDEPSIDNVSSIIARYPEEAKQLIADLLETSDDNLERREGVEYYLQIFRPQRGKKVKFEVFIRDYIDEHPEFFHASLDDKQRLIADFLKEHSENPELIAALKEEDANIEIGSDLFDKMAGKLVRDMNAILRKISDTEVQRIIGEDGIKGISPERLRRALAFKLFDAGLDENYAFLRENGLIVNPEALGRVVELQERLVAIKNEGLSLQGTREELRIFEEIGSELRKVFPNFRHTTQDILRSGARGSMFSSIGSYTAAAYANAATFGFDFVTKALALRNKRDLPALIKSYVSSVFSLDPNKQSGVKEFIRVFQDSLRQNLVSPKLLAENEVDTTTLLGRLDPILIDLRSTVSVFSDASKSARERLEASGNLVDGIQTFYSELLNTAKSAGFRNIGKSALSWIFSPAIITWKVLSGLDSMFRIAHEQFVKDAAIINVTRELGLNERERSELIDISISQQDAIREQIVRRFPDMKARNVAELVSLEYYSKLRSEAKKFLGEDGAYRLDQELEAARMESSSAVGANSDPVGIFGVIGEGISKLGRTFRVDDTTPAGRKALFTVVSPVFSAFIGPVSTIANTADRFAWYAPGWSSVKLAIARSQIKQGLVTSKSDITKSKLSFYENHIRLFRTPEQRRARHIESLVGYGVSLAILSIMMAEYDEDDDEKFITINGDYPLKDSDERARMLRNKEQPFTLYIGKPGTDRLAINYGKGVGQQFILPFLVAANGSRSIRDDQGGPEAAINTMSTTLIDVVKTSVPGIIEPTGNLTESASSPEGVQRWLGNISANLLPAAGLSRSITRWKYGQVDLGKQGLDPLMNAIPQYTLITGGRNKVERLDALGLPMDDNSLSAKILRIGSAVGILKSDTPMTSKQKELSRFMGRTGVYVGKENTWVDFQKETEDWTDEEIQTLLDKSKTKSLGEYYVKERKEYGKKLGEEFAYQYNRRNKPTERSLSELEDLLKKAPRESEDRKSILKEMKSRMAYRVKAPATKAVKKELGRTNVDDMVKRRRASSVGR